MTPTSACRRVSTHEPPHSTLKRRRPCQYSCIEEYQGGPKKIGLQDNHPDSNYPSYSLLYLPHFNYFQRSSAGQGPVTRPFLCLAHPPPPTPPSHRLEAKITKSKTMCDAFRCVWERMGMGGGGGWGWNGLLGKALHMFLLINHRPNHKNLINEVLWCTLNRGPIHLDRWALIVWTLRPTAFPKCAQEPYLQIPQKKSFWICGGIKTLSPFWWSLLYMENKTSSRIWMYALHIFLNSKDAFW